MFVAIDTNCILPGRVGGIENYVLALIEALQSPNSPIDRLVLLTRPENQLLFERFTGAKTQVQPLPRPRHRGAAVTSWAAVLADDPAGGERALADYQQTKRRLLQQLGVDLVHFPGNTINPLELDLPVVLNLHDLQHRHFPQYFSAAELQERERWWVASARRADALLAASAYVKQDLCDQLGVAAQNIFVAPDPVQSDFFTAPSPPQLAALRERMRLPATFFLYPAACWPHKNHARLIRAFVSAGIEGAQLLLTGGGQAESPLPNLIAELGAGDSVRLIGRIETDDLRGLYRLATALVLPSEHESWSIPIAEAFASGCAVASSNVTSLPEQVGDAGLLFDPHDEPAMAAAMRTLAADAALRRELGGRGRRRAVAAAGGAFLTNVVDAYAHALAARGAARAA